MQGSSGELREIAAEGLGELVEVTSQEALRPFTVQITGVHGGSRLNILCADKLQTCGHSHCLKHKDCFKATWPTDRAPDLTHIVQVPSSAS
jgi:hypothetical protein